MEPSPLVRPRSFVVRGRKTEAQQRAIDEHWGAYGVDFDGSPLDLDAVFGRTARRVVEIGFGNGENLLALAARHPERDFLGVEVHGAGIGRVLATAHQQGLANLRVVRHDAVEVFENGLAADSVDEILIFFPDPWPKARHHRRRLVQPDVVRLLVGALRPTGVLRLATDWEPYAEHMLEVLTAHPDFENTMPGGGFAPRPDFRPLTRFEKQGLAKGHVVHDLLFRRVPHRDAPGDAPSQ